jgi:hypothetical protein
MEAILIETLMDHIQGMSRDVRFIFYPPGNEEVKKQWMAQWTQILKKVEEKGYDSGKKANDVFIRTSLVSTLTSYLKNMLSELASSAISKQTGLPAQ